MKKYTINIRQAPDGQFVGSCSSLPEARAQGKTHQECQANMQEVLSLCLAYRKERGEEVPDGGTDCQVTIEE